MMDPDALSNLPDNVIDEILIRVPFRDAVCTSILSKKWRYTWCGLPHLMLDSDFWKPQKDTSSFTTSIHNIMTRHSGPITNFTLCIQYWKSCPRIDNLLSFLSGKNIQHLVLRLPRSFELPPSFFTCLQPRHLFLQNCLLLSPPAFKGFDRLIGLELHDVTIPSKSLESLISHCLFLEQLVLNISDTLMSDVIEINALKLRSCDFTGDLATICLNRVPLLAKLSLRHYHEDWKKFDVANFLTSNFFESCSSLEHLHLDYTDVARGQEIPTELPFHLMCVKRLCMCIYLGSDEILCALCLVRSFPFLRYLEIQMEYNILHDMPALVSLEMEAFPDVISKHLREVKLIEANGSMREMQLIKLLLAKLPALVRMSIKPHTCLEQSAIFKRVADLREFERASPEAEVLFKLV
ncbi:F-box/FBD/LRR-repeat protein like [Capsicum galapagoense]